MFDTIVLRDNEHSEESGINLGTLCEALLFYQNVHIVIQDGTLSKLIRRVGIDNLRYLLDNHHCHLTYVREFTAVRSLVEPRSGRLHHNFVAVGKVPGNAPSDRKFRSREYVADSIREVSASIPQGKIDRLAERIHVSSIADLSYGGVGILQSARNDILDNSELNSAIRLLLELLVPGYIPDQSVLARIHDTNNGFVFEHNLDLPRLNDAYQATVPPGSGSLTEAFLLTRILSSRLDLAVALRFGTDIVSSNLSSALLTQKISGILDKAAGNAAERNDFDNVVLAGAPSLRDSINSGEMPFEQFLTLLERATRFKRWLRNLPPDVSLVNEYHREISKQDWYSRLPAKSLRFVFFTGLGLFADVLAKQGVGSMIGVGLGAADTFILDKLLKKWKPNQFVDDVLLNSLRRN